MKWQIEHTTAAALLIAVSTPVGTVLAATRLSRQTQHSIYGALHNRETNTEISQLRLAVAQQAAAVHTYLLYPYAADAVHARAAATEADHLASALARQTADVPAEAAQADRMRTRQILLNQLGNALRCAHERGMRGEAVLTLAANP